LATTLQALTIDLKRGMEGGSAYVILDLRDKVPFECYSHEVKEGRVVEYRCVFPLVLKGLFRLIKNDFFNISYESTSRKFILKVEPLKNSKIFSLPPILYEKSQIDKKLKDKSKHWTIIGYENRLPFLGEHKVFYDSLSFPIDWKKFAYLSVGAVDISGNPVFVEKNRDVEKFIAIKKAFKNGKYDDVIELVKSATELYPDSVFSVDFLRYKIKALAEIDMRENANEIIKLAKSYLKNYPQDESIPEILLIMARVHSAIESISDANYFYDRLIHEYKDSKYANLGKIYLADQFFSTGKIKEAMNLYNDALYSARDLEVASLAAYKLVIRNLDIAKIKKAVYYLKKLWKKNPNFILRDSEDAHKIAQDLAQKKEYDYAIEINKGILQSIKKLAEFYENTLYEVAKWSKEKGDIEGALAWYRRYIKEFPYGKYSDVAKVEIDSLFLKVGEKNATLALEKYDKMIKKYKDSDNELSQKAFILKLQLMLKLKMYDEVIRLKDKIIKLKDKKAIKLYQDALVAKIENLYKDKKYEDVLKQKEIIKKIDSDKAYTILRNSYIEELKLKIKSKKCEGIIAFVEKYNEFDSSKYDDIIFNCYKQFSKYKDALKISEKYINTKDPKNRIKWLCNSVHIFTKLDDFVLGYKALKDLDVLLGIYKSIKCKTYDYDKADILYGFNDYVNFLIWIKELYKKDPNNVKLCEYLKKSAELSEKNQDSIELLWSLKELMSLQNRKNIHPYSPWVEFKLAKIYKGNNKYKEAIKVYESLKNLKLSSSNKARWLYEYGELLLRDGKNVEANNRFKECVNIKNNSPWKQLCEDALSIE